MLAILFAIWYNRTIMREINNGTKMGREIGIKPFTSRFIWQACVDCGKEHDFSNSIDYVGAVDQWKGFGDKCYVCGRGFCHCQEKD